MTIMIMIVEIARHSTKARNKVDTVAQSVITVLYILTYIHQHSNEGSYRSQGRVVMDFSKWIMDNGY